MSTRSRTYLAVFILYMGSAFAAEMRPLTVRSSPGKPLLLQMTNSALGIAWTNSLPPSKYIERQNLLNGAGLALGDYDGDGLCDIFLCGKLGPSALYRNLGNWKFEDVTARAGVSCANQITTGAVFADYDGDARLDLFVTSFLGPNACFRNLGNGTFKDVTDEVGLRSPGGATSLALADLDGDNDLDLYVNYFGIEALLRDGVSFNTRMVAGRPVVTGRYGKRLLIVDGKVVEIGEPDIVYRNDGGRFTALKWEEFFTDEQGKPMSAPPDFGLAVHIRDVDLDGDPDIYTCNDFQTPDRLWLNDGKGRFKAIPTLALRNRSYASMGVDFADIDRDGDLDFVTVEMLSRDPKRALRQSSPMSPTTRRIGEIANREDVARNGLYVNRGDGTYAEIAWAGGVAATDWSWTPIFLDVDLDGYEDLLVSNGHVHDVSDRDSAARTAGTPQESKRQMLLQYPRIEPPKAAFRNHGNLTFEDVSSVWGFNSTLIVHGMATADLDGDGDLDIVGNAANSGPMIYQNSSSKPRVAVRLRGKTPNTQGIGARLVLRGGMHQMQEMLAGGRYLSGDETLRVFAVPNGADSMQLEITWRNGSRSQVDGVKANTLYEIDEANATPKETPPEPKAPAPMFEDASALLAHIHHESEFNDFERQPLLPRKFSQLGPGLAWFDLDGDGTDELIAGTGRGESVRIMRRTGSRFSSEVLGKTSPDDTTAIVGTVVEGTRLIVAGQSHYESGKVGAPVEFVGSRKPSSLAPLERNSSPGAVAIADVDGDGDLDMFVAGRIVPGNYPAAPSSALYRLEAGEFVRDESAGRLIQPNGLITSAVFSDLDSDGFSELITVEEWGPVRIYKNDRGQFTQRVEAEASHGLWNSVTTGDLNGDGRPDIIAGNIGRNNHIARGASRGHWLLLCELDPSLNGELIEAYAQGGLVVRRDLQTLRAAMPPLADLFPSHEAFARADMNKALGPYLARARSLIAMTGDSCILRNEGSKGWRPQPLPAEVQWAPAFGLNVADFDNDGFEDLFVAQNFFAVRPEDDREDAGRGLLLKGTRNGELKPLAAQASGIEIYGEQRGSAASDFDHDGRVDLAVAQNGAATKLYRNVTAPAGIRVRLKGPAGNPLGYGAVMRPKWSGDWGPAREIHAGSGYWSQDSAVQIFPPNLKELAVIWPGGKRTTSRIPEGAQEVAIDTEGVCQPLR